MEYVILEVMVEWEWWEQMSGEWMSGGSRLEIQEEGRVMELEIFLFKFSRRSWREANWVRLSATS